MTEPKKPKQPSLTLQAREYINATTATLRGNINSHWENHKWVQEMERAFCSCKPARKREAEILEEQQKALAPLEKKLSSIVEQINAVKAPFNEQLTAIRNEIREIDRKEHPAANKLYSMSAAWIKIWVIEQITSGITLPSDPDELTRMYIKVVADGWRPKQPEQVYA